MLSNKSSSTERKPLLEDKSCAYSSTSNRPTTTSPDSLSIGVNQSTHTTNKITYGPYVSNGQPTQAGNGLAGGVGHGHSHTGAMGPTGHGHASNGSGHGHSHSGQPCHGHGGGHGGNRRKGGTPFVKRFGRVIGVLTGLTSLASVYFVSFLIFM